MKLPLIGILSGVALATLGTVGAAQAFTLVPSGLNPGDQYRLVFVTSGTRNATSTNIADYNTFVDNAAHASSVLNTALTTAGFDPSAISWTAIASTFTTNAQVNTATQATDTSRPIYRLDGALVATSYADLWDGRIIVPIWLNELDGQNSGESTNTNVWTGTFPDGFGAAGFALGGADTGTPAVSVWGSIFTVSDDWVCASCSGFTPERDALEPGPLYGISSLLRVPTTPTAQTTPEPSSLLGFITLGGLMLGGAVRKSRK